MTVLAGSLLILAVPPAALADDITIGTSADPVEDVTYQISVAGSSGAYEGIFVKLKATGGRPCEANPGSDDGTYVFEEYEAPGGSFSYVKNWSSEDSGTYLLCAWLAGSESSAPTAIAQRVVTVRVPRSSGSISAPGSVPAGSTFQASITAQTEVYRELFVDINSPGIPCGANFDANRRWGELIEEQGNTGGPFTYTRNVTAPRGAGTYNVCGYVQESSYDAVPEATFGGRFVVTSRRCPTALKARGGYEQQVRKLKRKLQGRALQRGDRGSAVALVQRKLHVRADGVFGRKTERAVKRFQRRRGLTVDGIVGQATRKALRLKPFISSRSRRRYTGLLRETNGKLKKVKSDIRRYCK